MPFISYIKPELCYLYSPFFSRDLSPNSELSLLWYITSRVWVSEETYPLLSSSYNSILIIKNHGKRLTSTIVCGPGGGWRQKGSLITHMVLSGQAGRASCFTPQRTMLGCTSEGECGLQETKGLLKWDHTFLKNFCFLGSPACPPTYPHMFHLILPLLLQLTDSGIGTDPSMGGGLCLCVCLLHFGCFHKGSWGVEPHSHMHRWGLLAGLPHQVARGLHRGGHPHLSQYCVTPQFNPSRWAWEEFIRSACGLPNVWICPHAGAIALLSVFK